jgi:hypothetical protein
VILITGTRQTEIRISTADCVAWCTPAHFQAGGDFATHLGTMTPNDSTTAAALSAVLSEAGAKVCGSCGTQAAVRVPGGSASTAGESAQLNPALLKSDVWFCFECGHEERAVD